MPWMYTSVPKNDFTSLFQVTLESLAAALILSNPSMFAFLLIFEHSVYISYSIDSQHEPSLKFALLKGRAFSINIAA